MDSFIVRHQDDLSAMKSILQEEMRLEMPCALLDETIGCLREYIHEMKAELLFTFDEMGMRK
jgi:hypothetical protein